jgi:SNF2 family DNA or RNA helicase
MLTPDLLHGYQQKAVNFQCTHPNSMLWLDMGLGKTVITLTSLAHLINTGFLRGVIIVAPIRVIRLVWRQEAVKWEHQAHQVQHGHGHKGSAHPRFAASG